MSDVGIKWHAARLEDFTKGWFVGNFDPTVLRTPDVEVCIKHYGSGESEPSHHHKVATEVTAVVSGRIRMLKKEFVGGDIIVIPPGTSTNFEALEDSITVVVKHPGVANDKYFD